MTSGIERGAVAVIFVSRRSGEDAEGYAAAAAEMEAEAARQPGYIGHDSVSASDGAAITVSYWRDEAAARAWREHQGHSAIREQGRARWYDEYRLVVAEVVRGYDWRR